MIAFVNALFHVGTLELSGCATYGWAVLLISLIKAIVVTITDPALRDAMTRTRASELIVCTGLFSLEREKNIYKMRNLINDFKTYMQFISYPLKTYQAIIVWVENRLKYK